MQQSLTTCPLSKALLRNSAHPLCNGASRQIQVVILWTLCSLLAFLKYAVKMPSSKSDDAFTLPNMRAGSDTPNGLILCNLWECIWEPVFLCLMKEHSLRVFKQVLRYRRICQCQMDQLRWSLKSGTQWKNKLISWKLSVTVVWMIPQINRLSHDLSHRGRSRHFNR